MPSPAIEQLLVLQERDGRLSRIEQQLALIPRELAKLAVLREAAEAELAAAEQAQKALEVQRKEAELRAETARERIGKLKTQQLQVKKNEEYQALNHEIEAAEQEVLGAENEELELMLRIEEGAAALREKRAETAARLEELAQHGSVFKRQEQEQRAELGDAAREVEEARGKVSASDLGVYDYIKSQKKRAPYVVPVVARTCAGCHLKISQEDMARARSHEAIECCPNCGRIFYAEGRD